MPSRIIGLLCVCAANLQTVISELILMLQPPQALASVLDSMVGQNRSAIDPSVQNIFRRVNTELQISTAITALKGYSMLLRRLRITSLQRIRLAWEGIAPILEAGMCHADTISRGRG